jgi:hypothetical protein
MELLYSDHLCCAGMMKGSYRCLREWVKKQDPPLKRWAIYRIHIGESDQRFHNSTDLRYLVDHDEDYWHRRGIPANVGNSVKMRQLIQGHPDLKVR